MGIGDVVMGFFEQNLCPSTLWCIYMFVAMPLFKKEMGPLLGWFLGVFAGWHPEQTHCTDFGTIAYLPVHFVNVKMMYMIVHNQEGRY